MLIIPSLSLAICFLTQVAVLAAPIPLNGISLNTRALLLNDDALLSRADAPRTFTFAACLDYLMASIPAAAGLSTSPTSGNFLIPCVMSLLFLMCHNLNRSS